MRDIKKKFFRSKGIITPRLCLLNKLSLCLSLCFSPALHYQLYRRLLICFRSLKAYKLSMQFDGLLPFCDLRLWPRLVVLLVLCMPGFLHTGTSNAEQMDKTTLKALYTYQFGKFTQWPDNRLNINTKQFQYCILGQNQFSQQMMRMFIGKTVQGLPMNIKIFDSGLVPKTVLSNCHVLFISKSERHRLTTIFASLKQVPVLTISDIDGFSNQGGMITLTEKQGKIHFQINPKAIQLTGVSMSSKIMELAEIVNNKHH